MTNDIQVNKYNTLFSPIKINSLELEHRIVMSPTHDGLANEEGFITPAMTDFYLRRAEGGVSMLVVGAVHINPRRSFPSVRLSDDKFVPGFTELLRTIHSKTSAKVCAQLIDPLKQAKRWKQDVNEVKPEEIDNCIANFEKAAKRAKEVGCDAIEIHGAHGYSIAQFLSLKNKRTDAYGGGLNGRMRLVTEVYQRVRAAVGPHYPVGIRINGDEFIVGGNTLHQSRPIARRLAEMGVDYISVSAGGKYEDSQGVVPKYESPHPYPPICGYSGFRSMPPAAMPEAVNVYLAADIRRTLREAGYSTPVITAGRIPYPELADKILEDGEADIIALSRPLLRDPDWVVKAREGREKEIKRCSYCNYCIERVLYFEPSQCKFEVPPKKGQGASSRW